MLKSVAYLANLFAVGTFSVLGTLAWVDWEQKQRDMEDAVSIAVDELECLRSNVYFEARNQSDIGQRSVAWVTLNRVEDKRFPDTICDVVWQKYAFSWTSSGKSEAPSENALEIEAWQKALDVASDVYVRYQRGYADPTDGADHFHADYVEPSWAKEGVKTVTIDQHSFYRVDW